ncbi:MAG: hypothetical protein CMI63_17845 [Parvularcula sp.]|nr:hypothetical protein [Parvularcula sp.]
MSEAGEQFWRATLYSLFGPLLWTLHFALVYGGQHVACAAPVSAASAWITGGIIAATIIIAIPLSVASFRADVLAKLFALSDSNVDTSRFLVRAMRLLSLLSLFGVIWAGAAAAFLPACPALR